MNRFLESLPQEKRVLFVRRYWYLCSVEELAAWTPLFQALCSKPGRSDRHIEHFGNGGADSPFIRDCIAQRCV